MSQRIWEFFPAQSAMERVDRLVDARPSEFQIVNMMDILNYTESMGEVPGSGGYWRGNVYRTDLSAMPRPRLRVADPGFDVDYMFQGFKYISSRLAAALDLDSQTIQYIEVDCSECAPAVQAMGYRLINPQVFASPLDRQRMQGVFVEIPLPDGGTAHIWRRDLPRRSRAVPEIHFQESFAPPAPLFQIPGSPWIMATDALAERVMRAGFPDVVFVDLTDNARVSLRQLSD